MIPVIELFDADYRKSLQGLPLHRGARGVVYKEGLVALLYYETLNHYVLPGGGIEAGEDEVGALKRELLEEIGYDVVDVEATVVVKEHFADSLWHHHFFKANVVGQAKPLQLSEEERALNPRLVWKAPLDALEILSLHEGDHPHSQAIMQREFLGLMHSLSNGLQSF